MIVVRWLIVVAFVGGGIYSLMRNRGSVLGGAGQRMEAMTRGVGKAIGVCCIVVGLLLATVILFAD
jgi:hypothetical protein